jgi:hypothetical protein
MFFRQVKKKISKFPPRSWVVPTLTARQGLWLNRQVGQAA